MPADQPNDKHGETLFGEFKDFGDTLGLYGLTTEDVAVVMKGKGTEEQKRRLGVACAADPKVQQLVKNAQEFMELEASGGLTPLSPDEQKRFDVSLSDAISRVKKGETGEPDSKLEQMHKVILPPTDRLKGR